MGLQQESESKPNHNEGSEWNAYEIKTSLKRFAYSLKSLSLQLRVAYVPLGCLGRS
jgi:hypothetical protein